MDDVAVAFRLDAVVCVEVHETTAADENRGSSDRLKRLACEMWRAASSAMLSGCG
jgi:hypothetical protein